MQILLAAPERKKFIVPTKTKIALLLFLVFSLQAYAQDVDSVESSDPDLDRAMCFVSDIYARHQAMNYLLGSGSIMTAGSIALWIEKESVKESWVDSINNVLRGNIVHQLDVSPENNLTYFLAQSQKQKSVFFNEMISRFRFTNPDALGIAVFRSIPETASTVHTFEILLPDARQAYVEYLRASQEPEMIDLTKKTIFQTLTKNEERKYDLLRKNAFNTLLRDHRYTDAKKYADYLEKQINDPAFRSKINEAIYGEYDFAFLKKLERNAAVLETNAAKAEKAFRNFNIWKKSFRVIGLAGAAFIVSGAIIAITNDGKYRSLTDQDLPVKDLNGVRIWLDEHRDTLTSVLDAIRGLQCQI